MLFSVVVGPCDWIREFLAEPARVLDVLSAVMILIKFPFISFIDDKFTLRDRQAAVTATALWLGLGKTHIHFIRIGLPALHCCSPPQNEIKPFHNFSNMPDNCFNKLYFIEMWWLLKGQWNFSKEMQVKSSHPWVFPTFFCHINSHRVGERHTFHLAIAFIFKAQMFLCGNSGPS